MAITLKHHIYALPGCILGLFGVVCIAAYELAQGNEPNYDKLNHAGALIVGAYLAGIIISLLRFERLFTRGSNVSKKFHRQEIMIYIGGAYIIPVCIFAYLLVVYIKNA